MFIPGFTFDDALLVPKYSTVKSRSDVDLSVQLPRGIELKIPLVTAPMKTVCGPEMANAIADLGGLALLHRFDSYDQLYNNWIGIKSPFNRDYVGVAIGVKEEDFSLASRLYNSGCRIFCVDVAHGDHSSVRDFVGILRDACADALIIAGNVATPSGAQLLWEAGADIIRAGIGGGCFAAGTRILMANATYKNIEDIRPGDRVINKNGDPKTVLSSFSTGFKKVIRLQHSLSSRYTCVTPDHKYWIKDGGKVKWREISKAMNSDLLLPAEIKFELNKTFSIKDNDFVLNPSYETGYVFGIFLGFGRTTSKTIHWCFDNSDINGAIIGSLAKCIKKITNKELKVKSKNNQYHCELCHKELANVLHRFGNKLDKHLPKEYIVNNSEYLRGLNDGLYLFDAKVTETGFNEFISEQNINELFSILTFMSPKGKRVKKFMSSQVLEYEDRKNEGAEVFDLTIDCDTHSFIADNAIVHNSLCTTRIETGNGYPQLSALKNIKDHPFHSFDKENLTPPMIMSDGGIRSAGDCVKALCFADLVMIGNLFAGTDEAPGEIITVSGQKFKQYVGSSTHKQRHIEGVVGLVPYKGPVKDVVTHLVEGIRSGCSYQGAHNLEDLKKNPEFVVISNAGLIESHPHDVRI